jgi:hypothetical protein
VAVSGACSGYKPLETGECRDYSSACAPQGGRAYLRDRTCSNSCTWDSWSVCKPVGSCGNGKIEAGEECDNGTLDTGGDCVFCKKARCGDGYVQKGLEQCDSGVKNGVPCNTMYGGICNYCNSTCKLTTRTGPYCGNGAADVAYGEQCDGQDFIGAMCETYGFAENSAQLKYTAPEGRLQCTISCNTDVKKCKTCTEISQSGKGDGFLSGRVKFEDQYVTGAIVDLLGQDNEVIKSFTTARDLYDYEGGFRFNNVATSTNCGYRFRVTYTKSDVDQVTYQGTSPNYITIGNSGYHSSSASNVCMRKNAGAMWSTWWVIFPVETCAVDADCVPSSTCTGSCKIAEVPYSYKCQSEVVATSNYNLKAVELWLGKDAVSVCGDGIKDANEECDNGNIMDRNGACVNCKNARCGDGYIRTGVEVCDFGDQNGQPDTCVNNWCNNKDYVRCESDIDCSCNTSCSGA